MREPGSATTERCDELDLLRLEIAALTYYLATVLRFFSMPSEKERERLGDAQLGEDEGTSKIDRLAQARAAFAVNPRLAVLLVDDFRAAERWEVVGFGARPDAPAPPGSDAAETDGIAGEELSANGVNAAGGVAAQ